MIATIAAGTSPRGIAVAGNHAYVVNYGSNNMMVFNISNPAAPSLIATIATGTAPRAVAVAGNYAYVLNQGSSNMMVFDISNPAAPSLIATIAAGTQPRSLAIAGSYAYVIQQRRDEGVRHQQPNCTQPAPVLFSGLHRRYAVAVMGNLLPMWLPAARTRWWCTT